MLSDQSLLGAGPDHTGAIVGGVLGGLAGLALLLWLIVAGIWSWRSYSFRAYKRLLEDQVYSLVIGMRSDDIFAPEPADNNLQVGCCLEGCKACSMSHIPICCVHAMFLLDS